MQKVYNNHTNKYKSNNNQLDLQASPNALLRDWHVRCMVEDGRSKVIV